MIKFLIELFVSTMVFVLIWTFAFQHSKMHLMPYDYAMWKAKFDISNSSGKNYKTIILGDSLSGAAINPNLISEDMFNLSLGGSSPIEAKELLKNYLENHTKPEKVIISFAAKSLVPNEVFKLHTLSFNLLRLNTLYDLLHLIKIYPSFYSNGMRLPYDIKIDQILKNSQLLYAIDTSLSVLNLNLYQLSFAQNIFTQDVFKLNTLTYQETINQKGQHLFSEELRNSSIKNPEIGKNFIFNSLIDQSLRELLLICANENIKVIFIPAPMNQIYLDYLEKDFFIKFKEYLNSLSKIGNTQFVANFPIYSTDFFSDPDHVNQRGMIKFSLELKAILARQN